jgi:hypothetical protein
VAKISPDFAARKILLAAYCYYVLDYSMMTDAKYDRLSDYVARRWKDVDPDRQFALCNPCDTRSTGMHFRFSVHTVGAALNYYKYATGKILEYKGPWRRTNKGRRFITCGDKRPRSVV